METEGKQIVDTPEWMVKAGLVWKYKGFEVVPSVRYLGERHGDAEHTEHVDDYVVADLGVHYRYEDASFADALKVSLNLYNLFDTEYVSMISASDDAQSGKASYYVGAPLTAVLSVGVEF